MTAPKGNAIVSQSGGPTGVINASLVGVIEAAQKCANIERIFGAVHAVSGIVKDEFVELTNLDGDMLNLVAGSPSSALGSSRDKPDVEYCNKIIDICKNRGVRYFYYIGGNDSANTCKIINEQAEAAGYEMRAFHVPKTIDNDLRTTDHCPGYGTAAKFVACAVKGDDLDNRALPGVKIDVIMGRDAGWLTAATTLAQENDDDGPHLVYMPEAPVSMEKFVADIQAVYDKLGRCVVAVSEGIKDTDGTTWAKKIAENVEVDSHGNVQLSGSGALADFLAGQVKSNTKIKRVRADTFGYLQRSFAGLQSESDVVEARETGRKAVEFSQEFTSGSAIMKRVGEGADYKVVFERTELKNVAEFTKELPEEFINSTGNGVTQAFKDYALPLCGKLPKTAYLGNMPKV